MYINDKCIYVYFSVLKKILVDNQLSSECSGPKGCGISEAGVKIQKLKVDFVFWYL